MTNKINKPTFKNAALIVLGAGFFIADRILKTAAISDKLPNFQIKNWLLLEFTGNRYISFSLPIQGTVLEILITILTTWLILLAILHWKQHKLISAMLLVIALGSISNLIDRFSCGYVIDYIYIKNLFIFNLADVIITIPAVMIALQIIQRKKRKE